MLFHLLLTPVIGNQQIATLIGIPLITTFFLFAKKQYDEVKLDRSIISEEEAEIDELMTEEEQIEAALSQNIYPKLYEIWQKLSSNTITKEQSQTQVASLLGEIQQTLENQKAIREQSLSQD